MITDSCREEENTKYIFTLLKLNLSFYPPPDCGQELESSKKELYLELARSRSVCPARIGWCLKWLQSYMGEQLETIKLQVTDVVSNSLVFV